MGKSTCTCDKCGMPIGGIDVYVYRTNFRFIGRSYSYDEMEVCLKCMYEVARKRMDDVNGIQ